MSLESTSRFVANAKSTQLRGRLLVIAADFPPETVPIANRAAKLLAHLKQDWNIQVLTATPKGALDSIPVVVSRSLPNFLAWLRKLKLEKLLEWLIYPDDRIFWLIPAIIRGWQMIQQQNPDRIVVFMMPYSAGWVGICLKWLTKVPLVLNLNDSPTCVDMHPTFPSRLHYHLAQWIEDFCIRQADAVIYVSQVTLETVRSRQPSSEQAKFNLVRCGADLADFRLNQVLASSRDTFEIVYVGGMTGWYEFYPAQGSRLKRLYQQWQKLGQHQQSQIDHRSSSPMFIGAAVQRVLEQHPEWRER